MTIPLPSRFIQQSPRVAVVGAGGNGCQIVYGLARLHAALSALGHFGLRVDVYDPDHVSESNIARQTYSPSDLGLNKAVVLVHRLNLFYGLDWQAFSERFEKSERRSSHAYDLVIGCVDTRASRRAIAKTLDLDCWWLDLGNSASSGQVVLGLPFLPEHSRGFSQAQIEEDAQRPPVVTELFPEILDPKQDRFEETLPSCSVLESLERQDLFLNQAVATYALHLLWTWFRRGHLTIHGYWVNLESGHAHPMPCDRAAWQRVRANGRPLALGDTSGELPIPPCPKCLFPTRETEGTRDLHEALLLRECARLRRYAYPHSAPAPAPGHRPRRRGVR